MTKRTIYLDSSRCTGCNICEVACQQEHSLTSGLPRIRILYELVRTDGRPKPHVRGTYCVHCGKARCIEACPEEAIVRRVDGLVQVVEGRCTGCDLCIPACPFEAIQHNPRSGLIEMCDTCVHLTVLHQAPPCVKHCPADALIYGDTEELRNELKHRRLIHLS